MNAWLQRLSVATIVVVAVALLGTGASLVARSQQPAAPTATTASK